jgi:uncharacterized membrane protein YjdF
MIAAAGLLLVGLLVLSGISPFDRGTWLMKVAPVLSRWHDWQLSRFVSDDRPTASIAAS